MPLPLAYNYLQNQAEDDQLDEFGNPKPKLPPAFGGVPMPPPLSPPMPIPPQFGGESDTSQYEAEAPNPVRTPPASTTPQRDRYQQMLQEGPKRSIPGTIAAALAGGMAGYLNASGKHIQPIDPTSFSGLATGGYNAKLKRAQQAAGVEQEAAAEELNRKKIAGETAHWEAQGKLANAQAEMMGKKPVAIPGSKGAYYDPTTGTVIGDLTDSPAKQAEARATAAKQQGKTEQNTPGLGEFILTGKFPKAQTAVNKENPNQWIADSTNPDPAISGLAKKKLEAAQAQKQKDEKENEQMWIATLNDPNSTPEQRKVAKAKLDEAIRQKRAGATPADRGQNFVDQNTGRMVRVEPGGAVPSGAVTAAGFSTSNIPTSQTRSMAEVAPKVVGFVDRITSLIDQEEQNLGPGSSRVRDFMQGKIGTKDREYAKLRTDIGLLQTALMRMHVGARGGEQMMEHFAKLMELSKQDPDNLRAALGEIRAYAQSIESAGKQRTSQTPPPPSGKPATAEDYLRSIGVKK